MKKEEFNIHYYLRILKKRRWTAAAFFVIVFVSVVVATLRATPVYKATAQVYIDPGVSSQLNFQQLPYYQFDNSVYLETQIGILKSETIAMKVIHDLDLDKKAGQNGPSLLSIRGIMGVFGLKRGEDGGKPSDEAVSEMVDSFLSNLQVTPVKNSNLVLVSYEAEDPRLAANVVNTTVEHFIEQNLEMKIAPARDAMSWLNGKLDEIRSRMTESSNELQDFKQDKDLLVTGDKQANISLQTLSELNSQALAAEAARYAAEVKYQQVKDCRGNREKLLSLPAVIDNRLIQDLKSKRSDLKKEISELSGKYGPKHPQMIRMKDELATLNSQIDAEISLVVNSIKNEYEAALKSEQTLKDALARQKEEAMNYERRSTEFDLMKQDVDTSRQIYDTVLRKLEESNLMGNIDMSNVQFIDRAIPPPSPYKPQKAKNILVGLLAGLITGVAFAFAFDYLDNTFKAPEDIEDFLGLPFLGMVPTVKSMQGTKPHEFLLTVSSPKSIFAETFRNIRGNILLSSGDHTPRVLQICSAVFSEGKSTFCSNLAVIMAAAGERVLIVDGDMRKPTLHKIFKVPNSRGLSSILSGQVEMDEVVRETSIKNVSFIPAGPISPNPTELLGSRTMKLLVAEFRQRYDRVIIDCPPYLGLADSSLLTSLTDGVLLIVRSGKTSRDLVYQTVKNLEMIKAKLLGVVLNDQAGTGEEYYYYYNYNYNYYYGQQGQSRPKRAV